MEIWLTLKDFPDYEISNHGRLLSKRRNVLMKPFTTNSGYLAIKLWDGGKHVHKYIHQLVAETFYDLDSDEKLHINHIDGNKENNFIGNLEYCTRSQNMQHAMKTGLFIPYRLPQRYGQGRRVRIVETGEEFDTLTDCANHIGGLKVGISLCLRGVNKTYRGYHFEDVN